MKKLTTTLFLFATSMVMGQDVAIVYEKENIATVSFFEGSLRDKPSVTGGEIVKLKKGDPVTVIEYSNTANYYKVRYNGKEGYVSSASLNNKVKSIKPTTLMKGLTKDEVIAIEGKPLDQSKFTGDNVIETWTYKSKVLNFTDGKLSSWLEK